MLVAMLLKPYYLQPNKHNTTSFLGDKNYLWTVAMLLLKKDVCCKYFNKWVSELYILRVLPRVKVRLPLLQSF